jgi:hypothetical protein
MTRILMLVAAMCAFSGVCASADDVPALNWNDTARYLAGLPPKGEGWASFTSTPTWKAHRMSLDAGWKKIRAQRLPAVAPWRESEIPDASAWKTVNYPFSGPDFLNAHLFFPKAESYVFYSLEAPGRVPDLRGLSAEDRDQLLTDLQTSLGDIFKRHYFITKKMLKQLRTPVLQGNLPLFLVFMAREGLDVVSVDYVRLSTGGVIVPLDGYMKGALGGKSEERPIPGVRIAFRDPGATSTRTLTYFSMDIGNSGFHDHPEMRIYLKTLAPCATFLKAASYLLHDPSFTEIRDLSLAVSGFILQDDSGFPYGAFKGDLWNVALYGRYTKTIKDFGGTIQPSLQKAYETPGAAKPLPFAFGYHWWDKHSNVQVARRVRGLEAETPK